MNKWGNSMKKMKSFWKILLQKAAMGILCGIIVCYIVSEVAYILFTGYVDEYHADVFKEEQDKVSKVGEEGPVSKLGDKISFRMACDSEVWNGINYIYMEDEETGEIVANSDRGAFIIVNSRESEEKAKVYRVDSRYLLPLNKYDTVSVNNRIYYFAGSELAYLMSVTPEYYYISVMDAYRRDNEVYPGTIQVMGGNDIDDPEEIVETITLMPENAEEYEHIEKSDKYSMPFIYVGNSYMPRIDTDIMEGFEEPLAEDENSRFTTLYDGFFWPGRGVFYGKFRYVDASGKAYIVNYVGELCFKDIFIYVVGINAIIMLIALIIALVKARKQYNREKYQYSLVLYQNNLIDVMAHDLRTPLMAMSGYAENLKEEGNADKRDYYIDAILNNTEHMGQIISRNLELTKIGTEDIKKNYKKIDAVKMIADSLEDYKPIFEEKKIAINIDGAWEIKGDEALLKTAFDNIASNMVKYVNEGGSIEIAAKGRLLSLSNTTTETFKNPSKLWDPFTRGDESRSNQNGTGLGLAIAKGVFDKHRLKSRIRTDKDRFIIEIYTRLV